MFYNGLQWENQRTAFNSFRKSDTHRPMVFAISWWASVVLAYNSLMVAVMGCMRIRLTGLYTASTTAASTTTTITARQRCFELVRNICNGIFQKMLLPLLVVCVCAQNCRQCINGVKQTVKFSLPVTVQSCIRVAIQTALDLLDCLFQKRALPLKIAEKNAPEAAAQQQKNKQ